MNDITPKEAIANLNHLYGMVAPDMQRSLDVAFKCMEEKIEVKGDLISRSALLNQIDTTDWSDVRLLVEDAPTVELDESIIQEVLNKRCMTAVANEYL